MGIHRKFCRLGPGTNDRLQMLSCHCSGNNKQQKAITDEKQGCQMKRKVARCFLFIFLLPEISGSYIFSLRMQRPDRFGILLLSQKWSIIILITMSVALVLLYMKIFKPSFINLHMFTEGCRWFVFKPTNPLVSLHCGSPWKENFGIFYDRLVYFVAICFIWCQLCICCGPSFFCPHFGMLH
jgi:hypothetical protein